VSDNFASPHDRDLDERVRPPGWINPSPAPRYDLVVVGAGTAGLVCAAGAAGLGARVALVERHRLGGDCLNYGCVPSKALIRAARAAHDAGNGAPFGVTGCHGTGVDGAAVMERMRRLRAEIGRHDAAVRFRDLGVHVFFGQGSFISRNALEVDGRRLNFVHAAVCTGARAAAPPVPGLAEAGYLTNETIFSLATLPARLAVIGGGPIGCELAQAAARLGSSVTVIEAAPEILPREDTDAAALVRHALERDRVSFLTAAAVVGVERRSGARTLIVRQGDQSHEVTADEILVGAGRTPNIEGLGLERAGIVADPLRGVRVNDRLRTDNPRVYAAGDICSPYRFTHAADAMARIVVANALFGARQRFSNQIIPWCTYTDPEVAHVGLYEREAGERGLAVDTLTVPLTEVDRALLDGEDEGFARVHLKRGTDRIVGATIVARHAGEMLNELTLAMSAGLGLSAIGRSIHPYPTQAEAIKKLADAWNRTRLTPGVKRLMGIMLTLRRLWR
jgi:pyruvate/2-oxoglutarate dehydrogenase complex dihydrolipoamide dehydrogenase (E3) component